MSTLQSKNLEKLQVLVKEKLGYPDEIDEATLLTTVTEEGSKLAKALHSEFELSISLDELSELETIGKLLQKLDELE